MIRSYLKWNEKSIKWLWVFVIIGVIATLPIIYERIQSERTAKQVEFVFNYRNLLEISNYQPHPPQFVREQLEKLQSAGVHSMAIFESNLQEFVLSGYLESFTSREMELMTQSRFSPEQNYTYILFTDPMIERTIKPLIVDGFTRFGVPVREWGLHNQPGLIIEMGKEEATMKPLDPDPFAIEQLQQAGFQLVVRISNRAQPFSEPYMDGLLARMSDLGVTRLIIDGPDAPGYSYGTTQEDLQTMGQLLEKHGVGLAVIEMIRQQQKGFITLAREVNHNVVRLHSFSEQDGEKMIGNITEPEREQLIKDVADRFVLAVKDRNIRMIYLNAKPMRNTDRGMMTDALEPIQQILSGENGAIPRLQQLGYTMGPAKQMSYVYSSWQKVAKAILLVACVALIALTIAYLFKPLLLLSFVFGVVGSAGLYVLSSSLYGQATALIVGICASSLACMMAVRTIRRQVGQEDHDPARDQARKHRLVFSFILLLRTALISFIGVFFTIGLLNNITYFLVLEQYRGVSMLHLAPIVIVALYVVFYYEGATLEHVVRNVKHVLSLHVRILWVVVAAVAAGIGMYYFSRTGNAGQTLPFERMFRAFLENTLGIRPRSQEFLIGHPLFVLGGYLALKYRSALYLFIGAVIGQLSIIDTFAHLHTPVHISLLRVLYGLGFGVAIGIGLIVVWEIVMRSWKIWRSSTLSKRYES